MKKIRKISSNPFLILILLFSFVSYATGNDFKFKENPSALSSMSMNKYSGEELFKSIIFMDGEASKLFPTIVENFDIAQEFASNEDYDAFKKVQNDAINYLKSKNSTFFVDFQKSMYSGDPVKIKTAILSASENLVPFFNEQFKSQGINYDVTSKNQSDIDELKIEYEKYKTSKKKPTKNIGGVLVLAIAVAVVAVVAFYVVAISEFWVSKSAQSNSKNLYLDELSLSIVNNLK